MEPRVNYFHDNMWSLVVSFAIQTEIVTMREMCVGIGLGWQCVESILECDQQRRNVSKCDTQNVHGRWVSSPISQHPIKHQRELKLFCMKAMVRAVDKGMCSSMHVSMSECKFPILCNIRSNTMCETWAFPSFQSYKLALQKTSTTKEPIDT